MTSEEQAFISALDAEPENHGLRQIFADWLDDRGDQRGPGMRALGRLERVSARVAMSTSGFVQWIFGTSKQIDGTESDNWLSKYSRCLLRDAWLLKFADGFKFDNDWWRFFDSRAAAEDAAAIAWTKLSPSQQARILADAGVMV